MSRQSKKINNALFARIKDANVASATNAAAELQDGLSSFIIKETSDATNTEIEYRDQVISGLTGSLGVERIMFNSALELEKESGPNDEVVYEIDSKDTRVRFVGDWSATTSGGGTGIESSNTSSFLEVHFWGTGLNLLRAPTTSTYAVTIDGGVEGGASTAENTSLFGVNFKANEITNVASDLTLGWHTVKIRVASAPQVALFYGVEILNESSDVEFLPGSGVAKGTKQELASSTNSAYDAGISGTKGARVVKYLASGSISQAVQEVDATQNNLGSTDHSNEELVRSINFREFGSERSDDFSTLSTSATNRSFSLEDNSTHLVGNNVIATNLSDYEHVRGSTGGSFLTLTFVGTGLDVLLATNDGTAKTTAVTVNNANVGSISTAANELGGIKRIVSGLPYGSHTVRFSGSGGDTFFIRDFLIYQPKKPSIPSGALEVADYNVCADYSANTTASVLALGTGVIRKSPIREHRYSTAGSWGIFSGLNSYSVGVATEATVAGAYLRYVFWGTGFDFRFFSNANNSELNSVTLNGSALTTANFPGFTASVYGDPGFAFNSSTGNLDCKATGGPPNGCGFEVSGLPLDLYTLTIQSADGTANDWLRFEAMDIITPIHINSPSLKTPQSLIANKKFDALPKNSNQVNWGEAKALLVFDQSTNTILNSKNISSVVDISTGVFKVYFEKPFKTKEYFVAGMTSGATNTSSQTHGVISVNRGENYPSSCELAVANNASTSILVDMDYISVVFFGELADE